MSPERPVDDREVVALADIHHRVPRAQFVPTDAWTATVSETPSSPGSYSVDVDVLTSRRYYEVRAVVDTDDGDTARGSTIQFSAAGRSAAIPTSPRTAAN